MAALTCLQHRHREGLGSCAPWDRPRRTGIYQISPNCVVDEGMARGTSSLFIHYDRGGGLQILNDPMSDDRKETYEARSMN